MPNFVLIWRIGPFASGPPELKKKPKVPCLELSKNFKNKFFKNKSLDKVDITKLDIDALDLHDSTTK